MSKKQIGLSLVVSVLVCAAVAVWQTRTVASTCPDEAMVCLADTDGDGHDDAILLRDSNWLYPQVAGKQAEVYRHSGSCTINGTTVQSNGKGYYVLDASDLGDCTASFTLVQTGADTNGNGSGDEDVWWQLGACASSPDDFGGLCESMGGHNYSLRIDVTGRAL